MNQDLNEVKHIADRLIAAGATQCLVVGGCVRDFVMGRPSHDIDLEVYGLSYARIMAALEPVPDVDLVGQEFGVIRIGTRIDVSIPRRENKCGLGHCGFDIDLDPSMTPIEAASRRDFTVNSMAMTLDGEVIDFFNAREDLAQGVLRATSSAFAEDPLRVLRGMQFASRFGFDMEPGTIEISRSMKDEFKHISLERICTEWFKWSMGSQPSKGLELLQQTGWIENFPLLVALIECPQDPKWHPEGDVFDHTALVCDAGARIAERDGLLGQNRTSLLFACLCHDLGKPVTTIRNDSGRWIAPGHAGTGVPLAKEFLHGMKAPNWLITTVSRLVAEHMAHLSCGNEKVPSPRQVRRLAYRLDPVGIGLWSAICEADHSGRPPLPQGNPVLAWVKLAEELAVLDGRPKPILMGRHLLERGGYEPGPRMGGLLRLAYQVQLDGVFDTLVGALEWLEENGYHTGDRS